MGEFPSHFAAGEVNATWIGWRLTVTNRIDGQVVTGGLSDYEVDAQRGHVWLHMGGRTVELRAEDTVTAGGLDVLGGPR